MAKKKQTTERRFNFVFPSSVCRDLDALQNETDAASTTEVVRRAVQLQRRILKHQKRGGEIVLRNGDGEQVLVIG